MNMFSRLHKDESGHSFLELVAVCVIIGILATIIIAGFATVERNRQNQQRQTDINNIYQQLESYYVVHSFYPTFANMNDTVWVGTNLPDLNLNSLRDPKSKSYLLTSLPTKNAFAYQVTAADGSACNNIIKPCIHYTLTATLTSTAQHTYVRSSLN
jgi:type II secretory pathway pseudopilin PulG